MSDHERIAREAEFQDKRILEDDAVRKPAEKYYVLMRLPRARYNARIVSLARGQRLLEYGCSDGEATRGWTADGAHATGIDISPAAITAARTAATEAGLDIRYEVMNAEAMEFPSDSFDVVAGTGILHHLDLAQAFAEIARVLDTDGHAIFIEPLGHNPIINLYRRMTPAMRSEDEHPLQMRDLALAKRHFREVRLHFFNLTTLAIVPLRNTPIFAPLHAMLRAFDTALFTLLPFTRRWAWMVLIELASPLRAAP